MKAKEVEPPELIVEPELISVRRSHARLAKGPWHGPVVLSGAQLFASRGPDAISFVAVHKVFEQIEWAGRGLAS